MRKGFLMMAAVAAVFGTMSCKKDNVPSMNHGNANVPVDGERTELTVGIATGMTKSTTITAEDEVKVNNLQVFVFRGDALDAYGVADNASTVTVSCTKGNREVYAVVNAPDLKDIATKTDLLATKSALSDNDESNFVMIGKTNADLPSELPVNVEVDRIVSKVVLKTVNRAFTSAALAALNFSIDEIFITNVAGDVNYGLTDNPLEWYNKMDYNSEMAMFTHDAPAASVVNEEAYSTQHTFYCYPNKAADSDATSWSPRRTRLVLKTTLGTDTYYYPVTLPELENNKSYELELTITRPGSDSPDNPVSFADCTFSISVKPWTVITVSDGVEI